MSSHSSAKHSAVLRRELELGAIAEGDVFAQDAALAQLEATLPPLNRQLQQARDSLAALTGHLPADFRADHIELDQLELPTDLPLGVPSQLVERRPDVRAAEAQLHAATAQVGVAIANLLPQITITGDIGSAATAMRDLFKAGTGFWSIGANATQTLFEGGTLLHRKRAADAALDQAGANYRSAVLTAFQNVADALHALDTDADALNAASRAMSASQKSLDVVRHQLELGSVSYLALAQCRADLSAGRDFARAGARQSLRRHGGLVPSARRFDHSLGGYYLRLTGPGTMASWKPPRSEFANFASNLETISSPPRPSRSPSTAARSASTFPCTAPPNSRSVRRCAKQAGGSITGWQSRR